jgi:hypothetical protein
MKLFTIGFTEKSAETFFSWPEKTANPTRRIQTNSASIWQEPQETRKRRSVGVPSRRHAAIEGGTAE